MPEHPIVLVASADLDEQAQLKQLLVEARYVVVFGTDAAQLVEAVQRQRPCAILLDHDYGRPQGGLALCRQLKANPLTRTLAVVMLCGRDHPWPALPGAEGRPDEVLLRPLHAPEVVLRLGTVQRLRHDVSEVAQGSRLDPLTGTFNQGYLTERLEQEVSRAKRYGRSLAVVILTLDRFGELHAREGSAGADLLLRETARALASRLRGVDLVARTGAAEFTVILPETSLLLARPVAERLRLSVEELRAHLHAKGKRPLEVSVSLGIAGLPHREVADSPALLRCARAALQRAGAAGGNRCVLY